MDLSDLLNIDSATELVQQTTAITEATSVEASAWGVADVLLDTGAAEGIAMLFGAPAVVLVALRGFKSYRKRKRANSN
jgi:uncharacterized membrane protein (UPF0136 family)